jgi:formate hydrogenlyase transcriptional activator
MATAAVIDFGSFSSPSGAERVQSRLGSRIELGEFVDAACDGCATELDGIVGSSPALRTVLDQVRIVAPTGATVLIEGETGTGKELIARAIHVHSERRHRPFVKVNCAAIPAELLESELFGHERGAFTGAVAQRIGRFESADGGTLFLDEIGEMPLHLQTKLLRVVQEQEFERVGGSRTINVDVRIVAATNRDLKGMVEESKFRADLYYRLAVFPLNVPPLRERREDIPVLARYFVQKHARRMDRKIERIPTHALEALANYDWPGNIRELQNVIERSVVLSSGPELRVALPEMTIRSTPIVLHVRASNVAELSERGRILQVLKETKGMVGGTDGAAARLGLKRTTLQSRMRKYNIARLFL